MANRSGAIVIGEALIDIVRRPGQPDHEYPGGSPLNVAVGLGRLGHPVTLFTWIGSDAYGQLIKRHCAESNVALLPGCDGAPRTSTALAQVDAAGHADYTFDLLWRVLPLPNGAPPLVAHTGSIGAILHPGADAVADLMRQAGKSATLTYDPNIRPNVMGTLHQAGPLVERLVNLVDLVKVSDEDLAWLFPGQDPVQAAQAGAAKGTAVVVVTRGGDGADAVTSQGVKVHVPAGQPDRLADTVGAGDSFMAGLIHGLGERGLLGAQQRHRLAQLDQTELADILTQAAAIAAITVSRAGANPPWLKDLEQ